jgi:hypothetical protein
VTALDPDGPSSNAAVTETRKAAGLLWRGQAVGAPPATIRPCHTHDLPHTLAAVSLPATPLAGGKRKDPA